MSKKTAGGVAIWAVNPTPGGKNNASAMAKDLSESLHDIVKPKFAYGTAPNYTKCTMGGWWPSGPANNTCGIAGEGGSALLQCSSGKITKVTSAHYGTHSGNCATGVVPSTTCESDLTAIIEAKCVGKEFCLVGCSGNNCAGTAVDDPCKGTKKTLAVTIECSAGESEIFTV